MRKELSFWRQNAALCVRRGVMSGHRGDTARNFKAPLSHGNKLARTAATSGRVDTQHGEETNMGRMDMTTASGRTEVKSV